jgi:hypothetical protein
MGKPGRNVRRRPCRCEGVRLVTLYAKISCMVRHSPHNRRFP